MNKIGCLIAAVVVVVLVGLFAMSTYNGWVTSEQAVEAQWGQGQHVYQRRHGPGGANSRQRSSRGCSASSPSPTSRLKRERKTRPRSTSGTSLQLRDAERRAAGAS